MTPPRRTDAVLVELTGVTLPAHFPHLTAALAATWEAMKLLPLDAAHHCAFELILARPRSEEYMLERLARDGTVALTFLLPDGPHLLKPDPCPADSAEAPPGPDPVRRRPTHQACQG